MKTLNLGTFPANRVNRADKHNWNGQALKRGDLSFLFNRVHRVVINILLFSAITLAFTHFSSMLHMLPVKSIRASLPSWMQLTGPSSSFNKNCQKILLRLLNKKQLHNRRNVFYSAGLILVPSTALARTFVFDQNFQNYLNENFFSHWKKGIPNNECRNTHHLNNSMQLLMCLTFTYLLTSLWISLRFFLTLHAITWPMKPPMWTRSSFTYKWQILNKFIAAPSIFK